MLLPLGRGGLVAVALHIAALVDPTPVAATGWGGIEPALTTVERVRDRWGAPTRETRAREEGHDTLQWVYEGDDAPLGMRRMTVDFGLLRPDGYRPDLVRALRLEPNPMIFARQAVIDAYGAPDRSGIHDGVPVLVYNEGLVVYFDPDAVMAVLMLFSPPLPPLEGAEGAPPGTAPGPDPAAVGPGRPAPPR